MGAADLSRFSGTIAIAENQTISGTTGVHGQADQWARDNGRLATDGQTKYLLRPRWASRRHRHQWWPPRNLPPKAMSALDTPYGATGFGKAATSCCSEPMAGRTLVSTTTLAHNQRLGLTTEESAGRSNEHLEPCVTPHSFRFHLDIELCVVQSPEVP